MFLYYINYTSKSLIISYMSKNWEKLKNARKYNKYTYNE